MRKPKVLLVPDSPNWAFDNRCNALIKHLSDSFFFEKVYWKEMPDIDYSIFDLVYYAGFYMIGSSRDKAWGTFKKEQIVTSIPGLVSWGVNEAIPFLNKSIGFSVLNSILLKDFIDKTSAKIFYTPNGVDINLFRPIPRQSNDVFTIGWAGHSGHKGKRLNILRKVVDGIPGATILVQDKEHYIPHNEMPEFYNRLDCYCCISESEGSNNSILEAMACGLPVISTPVGNAPELLKDGAGVLIKDDLSDLKEVIITMMADENIKEIGNKARREILHGWAWKERALQYKEMFDYALNYE